MRRGQEDVVICPLGPADGCPSQLGRAHALHLARPAPTFTLDPTQHAPHVVLHILKLSLRGWDDVV
jgi:hypothetical protein